MAREFLLEGTKCPVFRDSIRSSRDSLRELRATWDLEEELLRERADNIINNAELAQPATTVIQVALLTLLKTYGVRPTVVGGHLSGEIGAAFAARWLSHRTALRVTFHRGFMAAESKRSGHPSGAMLSLGMDEHSAAACLDGHTQGAAVVACVNSPSSARISDNLPSG